MTTSRRRFAPWELMWDGGDHVDLIEPDHLAALPPGVTLMCIDGTVVRTGEDVIDTDTRGGFIAYGFPCSTLHDPPLGMYEVRR